MSPSDAVVPAASAQPRPPGPAGGAEPAAPSSTGNGKPPVSLSGTQGAQVGDRNVQYNIFFPRVAAGDAQHPLLPDHREQGESPSGDRVTADEPGVPVRWTLSAERVEHFTGRAEELARLDRWAADTQVSLIGVTAWGGAGKTSLVTRWVEAGGPAGRPGIRGVFGWSFLDDPSAEHWAQGLLEWARQELKIEMADTGRLAATALKLLRTVPLLVVLDGLEVMQGDRDGIRGFGRLLNGLLREVLVGACYQPGAGLIVLTSRFPFADLDGFDGGSARMLNVPPLTPEQGSALLAAVGGGWLPDGERRALVQAVDGHALATGVLAGLLASRLPDTELAALRSSLAEATQTNARVGKVLEFYADRLSEPDRYLMAAVSLFARPVPPEAVLTVAKHEVFGTRLGEWTPAMVQSAVRARLAGLASWHREGSISAHPLVRDTFRHLVMDAAGTAAETALAVVPPGIVTSRADGLRVVEVIELLLDAGQWQTADGIYRARCDNGKIWRRLPATAFGQRAATAFVATPERRDACARHLGPGLLGFYLGDVGLFAMDAGDLETARRHLHMAADHNRDAEEIGQLTTVLRNLAVCLGYLGQAGPARTAAAESFTCAEASGDRLDVCESGAYLAWLAGLAGDPAMAEHRFTTADQAEIADSGYHLYTVRGVWWADWLARTGRLGPARAVAGRSAEICRKNGWYQNVARSDRMLGRIALISGDAIAAGELLTAAAAVFRDGDCLVELAVTLVDLADCTRAAGDLDGAEQHATEAIAIAGRRGLVPAHCAALAARARVRVRQFSVASNPDLIHDGRDDADAALRLAERYDQPWYELDALRAHAALDRAESTDRGWAGQAEVMHERLVPGGLDPDPLATIERLVGDGGTWRNAQPGA